jgi:hypothetical protein
VHVFRTKADKESTKVLLLSKAAHKSRTTQCNCTRNMRQSPAYAMHKPTAAQPLHCLLLQPCTHTNATATAAAAAVEKPTQASRCSLELLQPAAGQLLCRHTVIAGSTTCSHSVIAGSTTCCAPASSEQQTTGIAVLRLLLLPAS